MFYRYPFYRSPFVPYYGWGWGGSFVNSNFGINAIGSAISNQSLINTGVATGINQISTPTVIW